MCSKLVDSNELTQRVISHNDVYGDVSQQKEAVVFLDKKIIKRNNLLEDEQFSKHTYQWVITASKNQVFV